MHQSQWKFLKTIARNSRIPQCMIFSGMKYLDKERVAEDFIKLLFCESPDFNRKPCGNCFSCGLLSKKKHPDFLVVFPEKKEIPIEQARIIKEKLSLTPQIAGFKAVIIKSAEKLRVEAQNALLKTLEEPKGKTLIILITSHPEMLLETVRSRCYVLRFYPESLTVPLQNEFREIKKLISSGTFQRLLFLRDFFKSEQGKEFASVERLLESMESYFRAVLLGMLRIEINKEKLNLSPELVLKDYNLKKIKEALEHIEKIKRVVLTTNTNQRLALENLLLNI
jgi:DNA polymerase-3 subunit delta'